MKKTMLDIKILFPALVCLFSIIYLILGRKLNLGTMERPGVGFLPTLSGGFLAIFSLFQTIQEIKKQKQEKKLQVDWVKTGQLFLIVCLYMVALKIAGYVVSTCLLLFACARLYGAVTWIKPLIFSLVCSGASYYIFAVLLRVRLP